MAYGMRRGLGAAAVLILVFLSGCGAIRETMPGRSAMEQLLISTAVDRALDELPGEWMNGKAIVIEAGNLECYDKPYLLQHLRDLILRNGGSLPEDAKDADAILEVASGGLSINKRHYLLGLPPLPLPIPFAGETLKTPELAILKALFYRGKAKLLFTAVDPATRRRAHSLQTCYADSMASFWWVLLFGPFEVSDLPGTRQ